MSLGKMTEEPVTSTESSLNTMLAVSIPEASAKLATMSGVVMAIVDLLVGSMLMMVGGCVSTLNCHVATALL